MTKKRIGGIFVRFFAICIVAVIATWWSICDGVQPNLPADCEPDTRIVTVERNLKACAKMNERITLIQVRTITVLSQRYRQCYGFFPNCLEELVADPLFAISPRDRSALLVDPWQKPIHYDLVGIRNGGSLPDVWSDGPTGCGEIGPIGNWTKENRIIVHDGKESWF